MNDAERIAAALAAIRDIDARLPPPADPLDSLVHEIRRATALDAAGIDIRAEQRLREARAAGADAKMIERLESLLMKE